MTYNTILNELLDSEDKLKAVPKGKYDAEHAPNTFYINRSISKMDVNFSLPTKEGVKNYLFRFSKKESESEIHFAIQNDDGSYSNDLTGLNNASEVLSAVVYFSKIAINVSGSLVVLNTRWNSPPLIKTILPGVTSYSFSSTCILPVPSMNIYTSSSPSCLWPLVDWFGLSSVFDTVMCSR